MQPAKGFLGLRNAPNTCAKSCSFPNSLGQNKVLGQARLIVVHTELGEPQNIANYETGSDQTLHETDEMCSGM